MTKIYRLHYSNRENNPSHHGHCLYSSDSVSRCSFCCPKVLVHLGYTNGTRGSPLPLATKCLEGCPCQWSCCLWTRNQSPAQEMFPVLLFTLLGRFTPQSEDFHLPQIQTNCGPRPSQQSLERHFYKIWKLGNTCELHGSIKHYKNLMKPQEFMKGTSLRFLKYYWSAINLHSRENKKLEFLQSVFTLRGNHIKLWCMGICVVFLKSSCFDL